MGVLNRIGIAIDSDLLERFDRSIEKSGYTNRSEAFRDMIRDRLVGEQMAAPDATRAENQRSLPRGGRGQKRPAPDLCYA